MNTVATVTGWGKTSFAGPTSSHLTETNISVLNYSNCLKMHPEIANISTGFCGEVTGDGKKETCQVNKSVKYTIDKPF